ncbi:MAG: ABC transporter permease [Nitrososphaerales archaeon]
METFRASQRFLVLIRKEFVSLSKERTLPFTIVIQLLTVLLSVSLASSFAFSAGGGELETGSMSVVIQGQGESTTTLANSLSDRGLYVLRVDTVEEANELIANSRIDLDIRVSGDELGGSDPIFVSLRMRDSPIASTLIRLSKESLEDLQQAARQQRLDTERVKEENVLASFENKPLNGEQASSQVASFYAFETTYAIMIPLIFSLPALISGGLAMDSLTQERERRTLGVLLVTPVTRLDIYSSKLLFYMFLGITQVVAWMLILQVMGISIENTANILVLGSLMTIMFVLLGGVISARFKTKTLTQLAYSVIATLLTMSWFALRGSPINMMVKLAAGSIKALEFDSFSSILFLAAIPLLSIIFLREVQRENVIGLINSS